MSINSSFWRYSGAVSALLAITQSVACSTEDTDPDGKGGGGGATSSSGGAGAGGQTGGGMGGMGGGAPAGSVCANPVAIASTYTTIGDFDTYDGSSDVSKFSYALGDMATGVYAGPFGYGDRADNKAETFDLFEGQGSTKYGMRVADTNAEKYGGGLGVWLSSCINATAFSGISFWARGNAPTGKAIFKISMGETTSSTPSGTPPTFGTCPGTTETCVHPTFEFPVTDEWVEIKVPWASFKSGNAAGTVVTPNGKNITQFGFDIGLVWSPDASGTYVPTAAPYELRVDTIKFY